MKELTAILTTLIMLGISLRFAYGVHKGTIKSALSGWIIILSGSGFSLITYLSHEPKLLSSALNSVDVLAAMIMVISIIVWSPKNKPKFKPFEKWYLSSVAVLFFLWTAEILTAFNANTLTQVVMTIGYIPLLHNLYSMKENGEDYFVWVPVGCAALIALYPAIVNSDILAVIYASRALLLAVAVLTLMVYYDIKNKEFSLQG